MKFYGYFKSKYIDNGFLMPVFEENSTLYFQKIDDGKISLEKVDTDKYDFDTPVEYRIDKEFDFTKRIYVFKDLDNIYAGELYEILDLSDGFQLYDKYEDYFKELNRKHIEEIISQFEEELECYKDEAISNRRASNMIVNRMPIHHQYERWRVYAVSSAKTRKNDAAPAFSFVVSDEKVKEFHPHVRSYSARVAHSVRQARVGVVRLPNPNTINGRPLAIDIEEMQSQMRRAQAVQYKRSAKRATISKDKVLVKS